jgi:hypothetical protein
VSDTRLSPTAKPREVVTEAELLARFGKEPDFRLVKIPRRYNPGEFPAALEPVEFGSFFVVLGKR